MSFIPAGEIISDTHQVRTVKIAQSPELPDGQYSFIDCYCIEPECDCRKTMIQVTHNGRLVSIINYGWESPEFYKNWMGSDDEFHSMPEMYGASIDITSPDLVNPIGMLALFNALLNEKWIANFKRYYSTVKAAVSDAS